MLVDMKIIKYIILTCYSVPKVSTIELFFSSYNCDEEPRFMTTSKVYNITWYGQKTPHLCAFSFSTSKQNQQICFESRLFKLSSLTNGVLVIIKNNTKMRWEYDRYHSAIKRTCVMHATKLNISIHLPPSYRIPASSKYLTIQIKADEFDSTEVNYLPGVLGALSVLVFITCVVCMFCARTDNNCIDDTPQLFERLCLWLLSCGPCRRFKRKCSCDHDCSINYCYYCIRTRLGACTNTRRQESETVNDTLNEEATQPTIVIDRSHLRETYRDSEPISSSNENERSRAVDEALPPPPTYEEVISNERYAHSGPPPSYEDLQGNV